MNVPDDRPSTPPEPGDASDEAVVTMGEGRDDSASSAGVGGGAGSRRDDPELYKLLVASVRDYAIFALDPGGHIMTWNEGARRIKGYSASDIIGRHFSTFYPDEDNARGKPAWELEVAAREGRLEDEGWRLRKDGTRFWANVVITALRDERGELVGFAKVTRDLTERRGAEEELRQSEERFRLLVASVRDYAIFMLDPGGHIATWNEGAQRIKGYTAEDIIGRHFSTFYPDEDNAWGKPAWELELATRDGRFEDEGWRIRKDGTRFWANVVITAVRDSTGRLIGFGKVTRDLTERRDAEQRAIADARRLAAAEAASHAKSEFLATLSHELRTPLNAIGGYADLMVLGVGGDLTPQHQEYLARMRGSQQHLLALISDLLNFSRIETGHVEFAAEPVRLHDAVERAMQMVALQAESKKVELEHGPCGGDAVAIGDDARVEQILLNLLSNAVKFTPPLGRVAVRCAVEYDRAMVFVSDTGPGIPLDKIDSIFEPFVQLGRELRRPMEGTGLGLAISRDLARGMKGEVTVASTPGVGSTFRLTLPAAGRD